jgi:hypothetical protein
MPPESTDSSPTTDVASPVVPNYAQLCDEYLKAREVLRVADAAYAVAKNAQLTASTLHLEARSKVLAMSGFGATRNPLLDDKLIAGLITPLVSRVHELEMELYRLTAINSLDEDEA